MIRTLLSPRPLYDVIVLGTGAAGLTAAVRAHDGGAKVLIVERTDKVGGTSAVSGGGLWIPNNHLMEGLGASDTLEEAVAYCEALAMSGSSTLLIKAFVDSAPQMLRYLEERTPLRFAALGTPDYYPELPGGKLQGRSVEPLPFDVSVLGEWRGRLRPPSMMTFAMTLQEIYHVYQAFYRPWAVPQDMLVDRMNKGLVTLGQALVAGLLAAALERKIPIQLNTRALKLLRRGGRVAGVRIEDTLTGRLRDINARAGVILATAGFEWNRQLQEQFLPVPIDVPNSPPFNEGDGLRMAMGVGADLANMSETWNYPSVVIPGEMYEGRPLARGIKAERSGPHVIWVNAAGRRFVNEAANYNSVGRAFYVHDTGYPRYTNLPAWAIMDSQFRRRYVVGTASPDDPDPEWLPSAATLAELARKVGISADGLLDTVNRWNSYVHEGKDQEFHRGDSAFDRYQGDHQAPHPNLGTIESPPFFALPIYPGALGTKGGPRTDAKARVLGVDGAAIPGLYAVGNVAASVTGPAYYGVGSTLGPAMTWGYLAGLAVTCRGS